MHLFDSQVALAVIAKGRSSSRVLNHVVSKINALTLAGSMMPGYAFIASEWNPSDAASRRWDPKNKSKPSGGQKRNKKALLKRFCRRGLGRLPGATSNIYVTLVPPLAIQVTDQVTDLLQG